jgi:hypothetical protein
MLINHADGHSETWIKLRKHLEVRLDELRRSNDSRNLGEIETAHLRGRIAEVAYILSLDEPDPLAMVAGEKSPAL